MSQPEGDNRQIYTPPEEGHGRCVPKRMWRDFLALERRASLRGGGRVAGDEALKSIRTHAPAAISNLVEPDVRLTPAVPAVVAVHRRHDRRDTYLLVNTGAGKLDFHAAFAAGGRPRLFRPISGEIGPADPVADGYRIALDGYACAAIVFCP